jgi:predicted dehydrogenase
MLTTTENLRKFNAGNPKKPIAVGVVGCGYWGPNLVRNFKGLSNCNLNAMCDLNEARLRHMRSLYPDVEGTTDYDHMLNGAVWMRLS